MSSDKAPQRADSRFGAASLVVVFLIAVGFGVFVLPRLAPSLERKPAPDFALPVIHRGEPGARVRLSEQRGKPVLLDFWASWCMPCREQAKVIERVPRTAPGAGRHRHQRQRRPEQGPRLPGRVEPELARRGRRRGHRQPELRRSRRCRLWSASTRPATSSRFAAVMCPSVSSARWSTSSWNELREFEHARRRVQGSWRVAPVESMLR